MHSNSLLINARHLIDSKTIVYLPEDVLQLVINGKQRQTARSKTTTTNLTLVTRNNKQEPKNGSSSAAVFVCEILGGPVTYRLRLFRSLAIKNKILYRLRSLHRTYDYDILRSQNLCRELKSHRNDQIKSPSCAEAFYLEGPVRLELTTRGLKGLCSTD